MTIQTHFYPAWLIDERYISRITFLQAKSWIEEIFEEEYKDATEFRLALLDGVLLCRLINTIEPETIGFVNVGKSPITWLENVNFFLDGCRVLGLNEDMLFDPYDLRFDPYDDDETELLRRNWNIAVTLFWLSRVTKCEDLPMFGISEEYTPECTEEYTPECTEEYITKEEVKDRDAVKDDICKNCKSNVALTDAIKPSDGNFTLLLEKDEESNDFGVTIKDTDEGYPIITAVKDGSYAFKSGLHEGDYVITINGLNTNNMSVKTVNNKIKSVFTEGHVYLGVCRLPQEEKLSQKHKDSPLFKSKVPAAIPTVECGDVVAVTSVPVQTEPQILTESTPEWKKILERHKAERVKDDKNDEEVKELWNRYVKLTNRENIDDLLKEVGDFDINKAQKFKDSVVQTDGNDSLNRNLTLVGHKLKRNVDHFPGVCGCCVQPLATFASIHLDNTEFTYHQMCFSCKHCGIGLIIEDKLTHNVFIVDGLPYCDVCIRKMGTIKFRKKNKKTLPQLTSV